MTHPSAGGLVEVVRRAPASPHAEASTPYLELCTGSVYIFEFEYWTDAPGGYFYAGLYPDDLPSRFFLEPALAVQKARIEISSENPKMEHCIARFVSFGGSGSVFVANVRLYNEEAVRTGNLLHPGDVVSEKDLQYFNNAEKVPMTNMVTGKTGEVLIIPPIAHSVGMTDYMNLARNEEYVLEFRYWGDVDGDIVITDLFPDDLPETCLTVGTTPQRARLVISSSLASMSNAMLRFFINDGYGHSNTGNVYVANIRFYKKADLGKVAEDANLFRYCGEYWDVETNTYLLQSRYYQPTTGRFLSEDTYRGNPSDPLSLNLYTYSKNNPVFYFDPSGHDPVPAWAKNINSGIGTAEDYQKAFEVYENGTAGAWAGFAGKAVNKAIESTLIYYAESSGQSGNRRPNTGEPGSTYTAPNGDTRTYGSDGKPEKDVDTGHPNHHPCVGSPHVHDWENGQRSKNPYPLPPEPKAESSVNWGQFGGYALGVLLVIGGTIYFVGSGDTSMIDQGIRAFG